MTFQIKDRVFDLSDDQVKEPHSMHDLAKRATKRFIDQIISNAAKESGE